MSDLDKRFKNSKFSKQYYIQKAKKDSESSTTKKTKKRSMPKRSMYKGFQMDSGTELKFAKMLDELDIKWTKNTSVVFYYVDAKGKKRKYIPDFYLEEIDFWVEIKGDFYRSKNDKRKMKAVGENIIMVMHEKLEVPEIIIKKINESKSNKE